MTHFIRNLAIFVTPLIIFQMMIWGLGIYTGEAIHPRIVAMMQNESCDYIWDVSNLESRVTYRLAQLDTTDAEVFVVGSSRSTQFRNQLFTEPGKFLNIALQGSRPESISALTEEIIQRAPNSKIIIMEIDIRIFHPRFALIVSLDEYDAQASENWLNYLTSRSNDLFRQFLLGDIRFDTYVKRETSSQIIVPVDSPSPLGIDAVNSMRGYRCDGSDQWSGIMIEKAPITRQNDNNNLERFFRGNEHTLSPERLDALENTLKLAREYNVQIIGYTPPYEPEIYEGLTGTDLYPSYLSASAHLQELFKSYGFSFFDFSNPADINATSDMFRDAVHPSELATLLLYNRLVEENPDLLAEYSDSDYLKIVAMNATDPFRIFPSYAAYTRTSIQTELDAAQALVDEESWTQAITRLTAFLEKFPEDEEANHLLLDAHANVEEQSISED